MEFELPTHLDERVRYINGSNQDGDFILYWMRSAVRTDENPALDAARIIADQKKLPLLVYQAISEHYQFASDRHHRFMLEGARDVQQQFESLGIFYAFHLANESDRQPHLVSLANQAALVITEDMPVDPPRRFLNALCRESETKVYAVDTACVVPMRLTKKAYTRAFQYRSATKRLYAERLTRAWPRLELITKTLDDACLPFDPIDLQSADLDSLISHCDIDHTISPVADTLGGSSAGYERWNQFRLKKLVRYTKQRNNALLDGVSRMSAYLHYGMVSPFRLAREAAEIDNAGAEKYLDELLIWRELAYAFCFHRSDHDDWSAIPNWAQETLEEHANDLREQCYTWEQLARGSTEDPLWNAAQKSLILRGELHNNVRMTWGKAILKWTRTPKLALQTIIDLNHRFALDGRDPASYGGILWCLGQFDRPFTPEQNVIGTVRPRPLEQHAERLDPQKYLDKVQSPFKGEPERVALIGAGLSGLFAARTLQDQGIQISVFEKSHGVGGRMSTRRLDGTSGFDHGAQYFTVRNDHFQRYVNSWAEIGLVQPWPKPTEQNDQKIVVIEDGLIKSESKSTNRFVAVPTMTAICKHLSENLNVELNQRVERISRAGGQTKKVELFDSEKQSLGQFDFVISSAPAEQSAELFREFESVSNQISKIRMNPCWATMIGFDEAITQQWVGAFLHNSFLSWVSRNSTKPERNSEEEHLVLHATPDWSEKHWENDPKEIAQHMLEELQRATGINLPSVNHLKSHRWKYAIAEDPATSGSFDQISEGVVACGDWACGSRVEGAFLSGTSAAGKILRAAASKQRQSVTQSLLF